MSGEVKDSVEGKRLDSWKEIAAFFGRDERTVKRWEKKRSLPVHRVPGNQRSGVFAYSYELTAWLNSSVIEKEHAAPQSPAAILDPPSEATENEPEAQPSLPAPGDVPLPRQPHRWRSVGAVGLAVLVAITALVIRPAPSRAHGYAPGTATDAAQAKAAPNQQAVEFYLKGRYYWNLRTGDSLQRAADSFTQAIVIDPSYAQAYAGLADTYNLMREYTSMPESEAYPRAIAAATKAVELDDSLAEAHRALAFGLFYWTWDVPRALEQYRRAIALDPNDAEAHHWYANSLFTIGRYREGLSEIERARALNPASPSILADRGLFLVWSGNHSGGMSALKEIQRSDPGFLSPPRYLASLYLEQGDYRDFLAQLKLITLISKDVHENAVADAARRGWLSGGGIGMLEALRSAQQQIFESGHSSGFQLAYTCVLLNRKKEAVQYLQAAFSAHDSNLFTLPQGDFQARLSGDPDFERLKKQVEAYTNPDFDRRPAA